MALNIRRLTVRDIGSVAALYEQVFPQTPIGHLTPRSRDDLARILRFENVSIGVFSRGTLIGYQLWNRLPNVVIDNRRYSKAADLIAGERVLFANGTILAPAWQGRGLGRRLEGRLVDAARKEGYRRCFGQIFMSNTGALRLYLAIGRCVIGLSTDEFGLNFLTMMDLENTASWVARGECRIGESARISEVLEEFAIFASRGRGKEMVVIYGDRPVAE